MACIKRDAQELGRPDTLHVKRRGKICQQQRRISDGESGVGSVHSTLKSGEPATRLYDASVGKGLTQYAAGKGKVPYDRMEIRRNFSE
ncbi:MAG TPA: hypothetical protein VHO90_10825 [Bacteroidales bacterium]|nr:hypothetical protein [Bacteroidales bacterium]